MTAGTSTSGRSRYTGWHCFQKLRCVVVKLSMKTSCKHFRFIFIRLYRNKEICPGLMHKSLLPHSERLCLSGRGRDTQIGVYFQCDLHHALSDPVSATAASSRTPPFWEKNPSSLTAALSQQNAPFNRGSLCTARALRAHCALLLDYVPPKSPQAHPLETPLELGDPNCPSSRKLQTTFPSHNTHHAQFRAPCCSREEMSTPLRWSVLEEEKEAEQMFAWK